MAERLRKRRLGLALAAWLTVLLGVYGVLAVASIWGIAAGAASGAIGTLLALAVLTEDPPRRTRRAAKVGLALSVIALCVATAVFVAIWISER